MQSERGNILFLILLAVALFAALNYAVTNSVRGDGKDGSSENYQLMASNILQELADMDNVVLRWTLVNNRNINTIDFFITGMGSGIGNVTGCTDDTCNVFASGGGNVNGLIPQSALNITPTGTCSLAQFITGLPTLFSISVKGHGTNQTDLVIGWTCLKTEICDFINAKEGIKNPSDPTIVVSTGTYMVGYDYFRTAGLTDNLTPDQFGGSESRIVGKPTFCAGNNLYHVIYKR